MRSLFIKLLLLFLSVSVSAQTLRIGPDGRPLPHRLESLELLGTERMSLEQLKSELNLKEGIDLTDELVVRTREKLLSFGLFKSVLIYQRRGSKVGLAHLIVEVEDDDSVLGKSALGGSIGITHAQSSLSATDPDTPPLGYKLELVSRNLFSSLHRGAMAVDLDSEGVVRDGRLAYGLPRFALEDVQFDIELTATDVRSRYLNAMGFGGKLQGLWTQSFGTADLFYGPAMYVNREPRFAFPSFPKSAAGPKIGYRKETRLQRFLPSEGYMHGASFVYVVTKSNHSILELTGGYTFDLFSLVYIGFDLDFLAVGRSGYSFRAENRYDVPLGYSDEAGLFVRLRTGADEFDKTNLKGSSAILGLRYHSDVLIAEFGLEITRSPREFVKQIDQNEFSAEEH